MNNVENNLSESQPLPPAVLCRLHSEYRTIICLALYSTQFDQPAFTWPMRTNRSKRKTSHAFDPPKRVLHLFSQGCTKSAMDVSAMHGHLEVVKWLHENRSEGCSTNAMDWAAKEGKLVRIPPPRLVTLDRGKERKVRN